MFTANMEFIEQADSNKVKESMMHFLYLVKDGDVPIYAGKSYDPIDRLQRHLGLSGRYGGTSPDALGQTYFDEKPASLSWLVELFTIEDCLPLVKKHIMSYMSFYTEEFYLSPRGMEGAIDFAEQALIKEHCPCLNGTYNSTPRALPAHYKQNNPTTSSGLYLDIPE